MQSHTVHKIRIVMVFLGFMGVYSIALINLFIIQIKNNKFFSAMGQSQYNVTVTQYPPRAFIYDRHGQPLAMNKDSIAAFITPNNLTNPIALKKFLKKNFPQAYERLLEHQQDHFMYIKRRLTPAEISQLEQVDLEDIQFIKEPSRYYPLEGSGPIVGITDIDNQGLFGIELQYNEQLSGSPSTYYVEKEGRSNHCYFKKETKVQGTTGTPVTLTIDGMLQFLVYEELKEAVHHWKAREGSVIILDPTNGDILAMANYPDFDPNSTTELDLEKTKNKIITEVYEFGSVMKTFPAIAALEEGAVTPEEIIDCENSKSTYVDGIKVNTWKGHGLLPYEKVIELSNNIGTAKVTKRLGPVLYDHLKRFGFGEKTGIEFPGEQKGFINHPRNWSKQSLYSLSFGYELNATLLQLACAYGMIANYGKPVRPRLTLGCNNGSPNHMSGTRYSSTIMNIINNILAKTVTEGTARRAHIQNYSIRGKTGTANLIGLDGKYNPDRNIFTFACIVEKNGYIRVIVNFIKEIEQKDIYASSVAVPLSESIAHKMLIHDKVL